MKIAGCVSGNAKFRFFIFRFKKVTMFAKLSRTYYTGMIGTEKSELAELVFLETYGTRVSSDSNDSSNSVYSYEYHPKYKFPEAKDFVRMQEYYEAVKVWTTTECKEINLDLHYQVPCWRDGPNELSEIRSKEINFYQLLSPNPYERFVENKNHLGWSFFEIIKKLGSILIRIRETP